MSSALVCVWVSCHSNFGNVTEVFPFVKLYIFVGWEATLSHYFLDFSLRTKGKIVKLDKSSVKQLYVIYNRHLFKYKTLIGWKYEDAKIYTV